jgi:pSer/pThr/pTyr-binding forkhead associated (FHA) protein
MPPVPSRTAPPPAPRSVPPPLPRGVTPIPAMPQMQQMHHMPQHMQQQSQGQNQISNGFPAPPPQGATLSILYQGERMQVNKDRFVIGRGKQSSDLTLKDPNVSRQHAMIEFQNGVYFMVDMGSTNGVEYNGQRIARKQIAEGDVFKICDHDLVFSYR